MPAEKIAGEIFNAGYENHTVERAGGDREEDRRGGISREGADPHRAHDASERPAFLPRLLAQDRREARLGTEADDRGRRARSLPRLQGRASSRATRLTDELVHQREDREERSA